MMALSTAIAPALKSIEVFKDSVALFRCDYGTNPGPQTFVVLCPDGSILWGQRLPAEADRSGQLVTLPEIVADEVVVTRAGGAVEELICNGLPTQSGEDAMEVGN
jgi:hypothetical protein